jgi:hypothetical protein
MAQVRGHEPAISRHALERLHGEGCVIEAECALAASRSTRSSCSKNRPAHSSAAHGDGVCFRCVRRGDGPRTRLRVGARTRSRRPRSRHSRPCRTCAGGDDRGPRLGRHRPRASLRRASRPPGVRHQGPPRSRTLPRRQVTIHVPRERRLTRRGREVTRAVGSASRACVTSEAHRRR